MKYRLHASADTACGPDANENGQCDNTEMAYSIWQQGYGAVNAYKAVFGDYNGAANLGLDVNNDLANEAHYRGFSDYNEEGGYYTLVKMEGFSWDGGYTMPDGFKLGRRFLLGWRFLLGRRLQLGRRFLLGRQYGHARWLLLGRRLLVGWQY